MRGGALQVRDRLGWVVGEPEGDSEMVLRRGEFGIECECSLEVAVGFVAAVEDGEEEADLVLYAGGVGVERGGLLPGGKCGGSVTSGAGGGGLGFEFAELGLLGVLEVLTTANRRMIDRPERPVPQRVATFLFEQDLRRHEYNEDCMSKASRRTFIRSVCRTAAVFTLDQLLSGVEADVQFVNVAREAGLRAKTIYGSEKRNRYLMETTGCGCAFFDYDQDGWLDIFLVNGSRFEGGWTAANAPVSRLYKNNRDGTFTDVTLAAGIGRTGWGSGCCVGDFDNDGNDDLFVSYWGDCSLWKNQGNGKFVDVAAKAGVTTRTADGREAEQHRLRLCGLRQGRASGPVRGELSRVRPEDRAAARIRSVQVQGTDGGLRSAGIAGREEHPVPQQRRRHVHRRVGKGGDSENAGHVRAGRGGFRFRQRRVAGHLRGQRFDLVGAVQEQSRRHVSGDRDRSGSGVLGGRQAAGGHGRVGGGLRLRRELRPGEDEFRGRHDEPVSQSRRRSIRGPDVSSRAGQDHAVSGLGRCVRGLRQ